MIIKRTDFIDNSCLLLLLILIRLPAAFSLSDNSFVRLLSLFPIILFVIYRSFRFILEGSPVLLKKWTIFVFLYWIFLLLSVFQSIIRGASDYLRIIGNFSIPVIAMLFGFLIGLRFGVERTNLYKKIVFMIVLYLLFNGVLYFLHLYDRPDVFLTPRPAVLPSYIGIRIDRITFPTARGINTFGYLAGLALTAGMILSIKSTGKVKLLGIFISIIGIAFMFLVDSRSAFFISFLSIMLSFRAKRAWWIIILALLMPLLFTYLIVNLPDTWISSLSRSGTDALTLSNRTIIWNSVVDYLKPIEFEHFVGWGYRGQVTSGIMSQYAFLFSNYLDQTAIPLHNSFLQSFVEMGYIGLFVFVIMLIFLLQDSFSESLKKSSVWSFVKKGMLIFLVISSGFDSVLSIDSQETFTIFLIILSVSITGHYYQMKAAILNMKKG